MTNFPNEPKIIIPNFLTKLDKGIRLVDANMLLYECHQKSNSSFRCSSREMNVDETSYKNYIKGKVPYPIWFLTKFSEFFKYDALYAEVYNGVRYFTVRKDAIKLPKCLDPKLAYFLGYLHGDGYLGRDEKRVGFSDEYNEQMLAMNRLALDLFGVQGIIECRLYGKNKQKSYALTIKRNVINSYLNRVFCVPRGVKADLSIPILIMGNVEFIRWYLRGIFDADGTLPKNPAESAQLFIDIALKDLSLIKEIREALSIFGIQTLDPYPRKSKSPSTGKPTVTWELRIRKRSEIIKFLKEVGFIHPNKSERQKKLLHLLNEPVA